MKNNCWICGKEYDACTTCNNINGWRKYACTPEHYQIHQIIIENREGIISDKEATECLASYGITANSELNLLEGVTRDIKAIIARGTPKRTSKPKAKSEEVIVENNITENNEVTDDE